MGKTKELVVDLRRVKLPVTRSLSCSVKCPTNSGAHSVEEQ